MGSEKQCITVQLVQLEAGNSPWKTGHRNSSTTGPPTGSTGQKKFLEPLIQGTTPTLWGCAAAALSQGGLGAGLMETASR